MVTACFWSVNEGMQANGGERERRSTFTYQAIPTQLSGFSVAKIRVNDNLRRSFLSRLLIGNNIQQPMPPSMPPMQRRPASIGDRVAGIPALSKGLYSVPHVMSGENRKQKNRI